MSLNLAKRPFVNTRPANAVAAFLCAIVLVLSFISLRTVQRYLEESEKTRRAIAALSRETSELDERRRLGEIALTRYDLDDLETSAFTASILARKRAFSWTRLLTRLEEVLPAECRVVSIGLAKVNKEAVKGSLEVPEDEVVIELNLVSRDPNGLPHVIRAFYGSPYFDRPQPRSEAGPEKGTADGHLLSVSVLYKDKGTGAVNTASTAVTAVTDTTTTTTTITEVKGSRKPARKSEPKAAAPKAPAAKAGPSQEPTKVAKGSSVITKSKAAAPPEPRKPRPGDKP